MRGVGAVLMVCLPMLLGAQTAHADEFTLVASQADQRWFVAKIRVTEETEFAVETTIYAEEEQHIGASIKLLNHDATLTRQAYGMAIVDGVGVVGVRSDLTQVRESWTPRPPDPAEFTTAQYFRAPAPAGEHDIYYVVWITNAGHSSAMIFVSPGSELVGLAGGTENATGVQARDFDEVDFLAEPLRPAVVFGARERMEAHHHMIGDFWLGTTLSNPSAHTIGWWGPGGRSGQCQNVGSCWLQFSGPPGAYAFHIDAYAGASIDGGLLLWADVVIPD